MTNSNTAAIHSISAPAYNAAEPSPSLSPVSDMGASGSEDEGLHATRPTMGHRSPSASMIVSREHAQSEVDSDYEAGDVRAMSPRRNSQEVDRLGDQARQDLVQQAKVLQASLQAIVDRVEEVKSEHEKLEGGNKFLQSYIGELMQTSRITSSAPKKGKGRSGK